MATNPTFPHRVKPLNFAKAGIAPEQILALEIDDEQELRVEELVAKSKEEGLTAPEKEELEYYLEQDHFLKMMKVQALEMLRSSGS